MRWEREKSSAEKQAPHSLEIWEDHLHLLEEGTRNQEPKSSQSGVQAGATPGFRKCHRSEEASFIPSPPLLFASQQPSEMGRSPENWNNHPVRSIPLSE